MSSEQFQSDLVDTHILKFRPQIAQHLVRQSQGRELMSK